LTRNIADAPITVYKEKGGKVQAVLVLSNKWRFINVNKKYDFDNLSLRDIETLIAKLIVLFTTGRFFSRKKRVGDVPLLTKGKLKLIGKDVDATKLTLEVQEMIAKKTPAKRCCQKRQLKQQRLRNLCKRNRMEFDFLEPINTEILNWFKVDFSTVGE
jgi:DNA topoisomerase-1